MKRNDLLAQIYMASMHGDLVNLLVFIINQRMTQDLNQLIFAFPGASSGVIDMLKVNIVI